VRAFIFGVAMLTPVFIYSQLSSVDLTLINTLAILSISLLSLSLIVALVVMERAHV
jgi:hypothetical protein